MRTPSGRVLKKYKSQFQGANFEFPCSHPPEIRAAFRKTFKRDMSERPSKYKTPMFEKRISGLLGGLLKGKRYNYVGSGQICSNGCWLQWLAILRGFLKKDFELDVPTLNRAWPLDPLIAVDFESIL